MNDCNEKRYSCDVSGYSLDDVRAFLAVAEAGGFTAAAPRLGVTTNAVSLRVRHLENALGVRLLARTTRSVGLTDEGRIYAQRAATAVAELEAVGTELRAGQSGVRGNVRIALPGALAVREFLTCMREVLGAHPHLSVQLRVANGPVALIAEGLDIVVVVGQPEDSTFVGRLLGQVSWVLVAAPAYLDRAGRPATPADLIGHECLRFLGSTPQREWSLVDERGTQLTCRVGGNFEADDSRTLGDAAYAGIGIGIRPHAECAQAVRLGLLEQVLPGYRFQPMDVYALVPAGRIRLRRVAACLEALRAGVAALG